MKKADWWKGGMAALGEDIVVGGMAALDDGRRWKEVWLH